MFKVEPENLPPEYATAFKAIQKIAPEVFLGGGALRDWYNKKSVTDLDFCVLQESKDEVIEALSPTHPHLDYIVDDSDIHFRNNKTICGSIMLLGPGVMPINIALARHKLNPFQEMFGWDFGLCQVAYDGIYIRFTPAFLRDKNNKTFTLCNAADKRLFDMSMRRYKNFAKKYEDWNLVLPQSFALKYITGEE
jgi:hypothetical protein